MMKQMITTLVLTVALATPALAQQQADERLAQTSAASAAGDTTEGEVRKVDKEANKVTLKHGEIKSLDMPAMTMVFVVKDKAMLDSVKAGDKVRFKAVSDAGKFTVTEMQVMR